MACQGGYSERKHNGCGDSIIGFGIKVPKGLYRAMEDKAQYYNYTNLGVKYIDESFAEIFLLKMGAMIENEGYDACLQRSIPGFRIQGDKSTNPEVSRIYELQFASPVAPGKPVPDVIIDYNKAAVVCGLGSIGMHGKVIVPKYGPYMRFVFIITDMPLEHDEAFKGELGYNECNVQVKALDEIKKKFNIRFKEVMDNDV